MNVLSTFEYFLPFFHVASRHFTGRNGFYLGSFRVIYRCVPTLQPGSCEAAIKALTRAEQSRAEGGCCGSGGGIRSLLAPSCAPRDKKELGAGGAGTHTRFYARPAGDGGSVALTRARLAPPMGNSLHIAPDNLGFPFPSGC